MKVSVVIVNYNGEKYIKQCVDSVLKSAGAKFEVVIVENGSTDGSLKLLKKEYGKSKLVRIVESGENLFFSGGSNLGARKADGDWLVFLNSDTVVEPDWLVELVKQAKKDKKQLLQPKILSAKAKNLIDNAGGRYVWPGFGVGVGRRQIDEGQFDGKRQVDFANGTCLMIKRKFFFEIGGFDEWYRFFYEDVDLNLRAKKMGGKAMAVGESVIHHLGGVSFKQNVADDQVIYYVRRNRLMTVVKNFKGVNRWLRLGGLLVMSMFLPRRWLSLKAAMAVGQRLIKTGFEKLRLAELRQVAGKMSFSWLDLGCGDGELVRLAQEQGIEAVGFDEKQGQSIEKLRLKQRFKVVSLYHVLEHVEDPSLVLRRAKQWLKPDGLLVVEVPLVGNLSERWLGKEYLAYQDKTHRHFFTKEELWDLLDQTGWRVKQQGLTWHQLPLTVVTASFRSGLLKGTIGLLLWLPLKLLSVLRLNEEMIRIYAVRAGKKRAG
jgi:hypothetical protein